MRETIGLFGTCGKSTWREQFIQSYNIHGISFFNPQVPDGTWHPGCVVEENAHLMEDAIILFPVTDETTGQGSLAEIGFSINAALRRNPERYFVFLIDPECKDQDANAAQIKESNRSRTLVRSKLEKIAKENSGVFLVDNLEDMYTLSVGLWSNIKEFERLRSSYNTK